ncbi:Two-component system sensor histidine kinase [Candidatus Syntrophocurvum alkaliphilum]|uniref:histidine kinase n=1 Tax=Candidatus Syntrophocurvum alkaliphilum TaxID=2293317 RepID=A0A6I6DCY6_9FIRM|nr:sensor histidine kinase [Candidatus Syntrophocurvum alkaliphilum]QGU00442.1 Two-component system sensor histidine kinase [Candidatus Syntrophocurvum alkaliphilum]
MSHKEHNNAAELIHLDEVLSQVVDVLNKGQDDIFEIADNCTKQLTRLKTELENLRIQINEKINEVDEAEKQERLARHRLVEVSRNFRSYSEPDIKEAYNNAQDLQLKLNSLRHEEYNLRQKREDLSREIRRYEEITKKADDYLKNTGYALKILQGNVEKISESIEETYRRQQIGMWIIEAQESERRKIARELHDGPAQILASMLIRLDLVKHFIENDTNKISDETDNVKKMAKESLGDIRRVMFDLKPTPLDETGLINSLRQYFDDYEAKYNMYIEFVVFGEEHKYDSSLEIALFRLVQEAITNARKHSGVNRVLVKIQDNGKNLLLIIKDTGKGFDTEEVLHSDKESYGIMGMRERVELFGGKIDIISKIGSGTQVIIEVPIEGER